MPNEELIICGWDKVSILDMSGELGDTPRTIWSWKAEEQSDLPSDFGTLFRTTDECKPFKNGRQILITSSSGAAVLVDRETGRVPFCARAVNAHSADLLPGNRVAVAASHGRDGGGDRLIVFDSGTPGRELCSVPLSWAHGAVWDEARSLLWALSTDDIRAYKLQEWDSTTPELSLVSKTALPENGGHDLYPVEGTASLSVTTRGHCWHFDRDAHTVAPHPELPDALNVKSLCQHPATGQVVYVQAEGEHWWAENVHFLRPEHTLHRPDARIYKARWNVSQIDGYDTENCELRNS